MSLYLSSPRHVAETPLPLPEAVLEALVPGFPHVTGAVLAWPPLYLREGPNGVPPPRPGAAEYPAAAMPPMDHAASPQPPVKETAAVPLTGPIARLLVRFPHSRVTIAVPHHRHKGIVIRVRSEFVTLVEEGPRVAYIVLRHVVSIEDGLHGTAGRLRPLATLPSAQGPHDPVAVQSGAGGQSDPTSPPTRGREDGDLADDARGAPNQLGIPPPAHAKAGWFLAAVGSLAHAVWAYLAEAYGCDQAPRTLP